MHISEVAKAANVSPATVSRVLNDYAKVSVKTRAKVLETVERLGYHPNQMGQNLRNKKSNMLLVLVSDMGNSYFSDILFGMDETAQKYGYSLLVVSTYYNAERELKMLSFLDNKTVDGAILLATNLTKHNIDRYDAKFPIIQCCEYVEGSSAAHVSIDNYAAAYQAVKYLIDSGHKKIAYLGLANNFVSTQLREKAYIQALEDNGIQYEQAYFKQGNHSFDFGITGMQELLKLSERPTAVFATSDKVAAGCIRALTNASITIPNEMAVLGFDNIDISRMVTPPLSTVAQPMRKLGCMAIEMLVTKLCGNEITKETYLDYEIVLRKTT